MIDTGISSERLHSTVTLRDHDAQPLLLMLVERSDRNATHIDAPIVEPPDHERRAAHQHHTDGSVR
jgi:hypothetical protein